MNVRSYGSDMERVMVASEYYDLTSGEIVRLRDDDMNMDWDSCVYQEHPEWVVLDTVMALSYGGANDIHTRMEANMEIRQKSNRLTILTQVKFLSVLKTISQAV